jgi:hypothetical protein
MTTKLRRALTTLLAAGSLLATIGVGHAAGETLVAAGDIATRPAAAAATSPPPGWSRRTGRRSSWPSATPSTSTASTGTSLVAYDRSRGRFKARTRPAVGNHEYMDPAGPAAGYFRYFGRQAGDPRRGYYSFDVGPWHAVALNSACGQAGAPSCGHGSPQSSWLRRPGQPPPALHDGLLPPPVPVVGGPSSPASRSSSNLWALLVAGGVDVVLNGHNHAYERLKPMRTMGDVDYHGAPWTIVAGTGGRSLIPYTSVHRNSVYRTVRYGVYKMVLYPDRWVGAHKGTDGVTRDLRSIGCH